MKQSVKRSILFWGIWLLLAVGVSISSSRCASVVLSDSIKIHELPSDTLPGGGRVCDVIQWKDAVDLQHDTLSINDTSIHYLKIGKWVYPIFGSFSNLQLVLLCDTNKYPSRYSEYPEVFRRINPTAIKCDSEDIVIDRGVLFSDTFHPHTSVDTPQIEILKK